MPFPYVLKLHAAWYSGLSPDRDNQDCANFPRHNGTDKWPFFVEFTVVPFQKFTKIIVETHIGIQKYTNI